MKLYFGAAILGALAVASTACTPATSASAAKPRAAKDAPAGQARTVTMTDLKFEPATVTVKAGTPVNLSAANKGVIEHNWVVKIGDESVQVDARPGQTGSKTFTPTTAGTFKVICSIAGHEQAGMVGTLLVE